jgi:hypothetical protein
MRMLRMSLVVVSLALLLGMPEAPASARYGAFTIHTYLRSGTSGWVGEGDAPTITRRVAPGNGVSFEVLGRGHGMPVPDPRVFGCASTDGIDVRYLLETRRGDRDITEAIVGTGWTRVASFDRWRVRIRVAFRVGADVPSGTTLACRVAVNRDPVRAVVTVR